jgi:predicted CXXCH cytochrome family protein
MILAKSRRDPPRVIASICGQCHIRTGRAKSNGLPYPNNFVAGDNLFRDFEVDFSDKALAKLNPGDRHVVENIRDVVIHGQEAVTCLSCHDVHRQASRKHHTVAEGRICLNCHNAGEPKSKRTLYRVQSPLCGY